MKGINQNIPAGITEFATNGKFFLLSFCSKPVDLEFFKANVKVGDASYVQKDFSCWLDYDKVSIRTDDPQFVALFVSNSEVRYTPPVENTTSASVQDVIVTIGYFEPDLTDEEKGALLYLVDNWNMPSIDLVFALIDSLNAMVDQIESAL